MNEVYRLKPEEVYVVLGSRPEGLTPGEVKGLSPEDRGGTATSGNLAELARKIVKQFTHFFALLLWAAAALCFFVSYFQPGEGMWQLGWTVLLVILINGVFSFIQEFRAEKAAQALKNLLPQRVRVIRAGSFEETTAEKLVTGDVVLLGEGDRVPADIRLVESRWLKVSNAVLTGEADVMERFAGACEASSLYEADNIVFSGTMVISGQGKGVVFAAGGASQFGRIAGLTTEVKKSVSPLEKEIARVSRTISLIALGLGVFFFLLGLIIGKSIWFNILFAIGIIVALVPEGLLPTVTLTLAVGSQRMAKRSALVKKLNSIETLGCTTVICADKTGTITENNMRLEKVWFSDSREAAKDMAHLVMGLSNNSLYNDPEDNFSGDPMETALIKAAREYSYGDCGPGGYERLHEYGFTPERKRITVINRHGAKEELFTATKGAPEVILPLCRLTPEEKGQIEGMMAEMAGQALRVIALACKTVKGDFPAAAGRAEDWEKGLTFAGLAGLADPVREDVPDAVELCHTAGIRVMMITGDAPSTACAVAARAGIIPPGTQPVVLKGELVDRLSHAELQEKLLSSYIVFARMQPEHKLKVVTALQEMGEVVAMTGDGVNDAPALRKSDIGIAMGLRGTDVARETADIVLLDDHFATIVSAIEEGRSIFANIRKFMTYVFASNTPELVPFLSHVLLGVPLPLSIIQIMAIDLGTNLLPALALGLEKPRREMMMRPPRSRTERLMEPKILFRGYVFLGLIEALAGMSGFFFVLYSGGWHWGQSLGTGDTLYLQATTACLAAIILAQMTNLFACRSHYDSAFSIPLKNNPFILCGLLWEIVVLLLLVYTIPGRTLFRTWPLDTGAWLFMMIFPPLLLLLDEGRKKLARKHIYGITE